MRMTSDEQKILKYLKEELKSINETYIFNGCLIFKDSMLIISIEGEDLVVSILCFGRAGRFSLSNPDCFEKAIEYTKELLPSLKPFKKLKKIG